MGEAAHDAVPVLAQRPRRSRWWRYLLVGTGISLVLLSLLLYFLPVLLKPALNRWLPSALLWAADIDSQVDIQRLSWRGLRIGSARITLEDGTEVRLSGLTMTFEPEQLRAGIVQELTLDTLDIALQRTGERVAALTAQQAKEAARTQLQANNMDIPELGEWLNLPVQQLTIHRIGIQHQQFEATLLANLSPDQWRVSGDVQLAEVDRPWQLEVQLQQGGDWLIQVADGEALLMQTFATVSQSGPVAGHVTDIQLRQQWQLNQLQPRFPQLRSFPAPGKELTLTARMTLPATLSFPDDLVMSADVALTTQASHLAPEWRWRGGRMAMSVSKLAMDADWTVGITTHNLSLASQAPEAGSRITQKKGRMDLACRPALTTCELTGALPFAIQGEQSGQVTFSPSLGVVLPSPEGDVADDKEIRLTGNLGLSALIHSTLPGAEGQPDTTVTASSRGRVGVQGSSSALHLSSSGFTLAMDSLPWMGWSTSKITGRWGDKLDLHLARTKAGGLTLEAEPVVVSLSPMTVSQGDTQLQLDASQLTCEPDFLHVSCSLKTGLLSSRSGQWPIPDARFSGRFGLNLNTQEMDARVSVLAAKEQLRLKGVIQHNLASTEGALQWHLERAALNWGAMGLAEMADLTSVQLLGGDVSGQGWIDWDLDNNRISPDLMLRGDDISLIYDNTIGADQWSVLLAMRPNRAEQSFNNAEWVVDAQLAGDSLNSGVELTNLLARSQVRVTPEWFTLNLYEIHMNLLGGQVQVPAARFDSRKDINAFGVEIYRLQLAQLAALEPAAGIKATGVLDGVLPVVLTPEGPTVPGGKLFARAPGGTLKYNTETSAALKQSDPTVGLALRALENFHYTELSSGVTYAADGALNLALQFQGANPDFFDGQSTHLNINLDYNLLDLLESLRVADDVISRLEDKYQ